MFKRNLAARGLTRLALLLALTVGSLLQAAPARSQAVYLYVVSVPNPPATFCVGGSRDFLVRILVTGLIGQSNSQDQATLTLDGTTRLSAISADSRIGDFTSARSQLLENPDPTLARPGLVAFTFTGKKAGQTKVSFLGDVGVVGNNQKAQPFSLTVTVADCPYQIMATSTFKMTGEDYTATMDWVDLTVDRNGQFHATGNVVWTAHWQVVPTGSDAGISCSTHLHAADSAAYVTGAVNAKHQLVLDIVFVPVKDPVWHVDCGGPVVVNRPEFKLALARLKISLPFPAGGTAGKPQALIDTASGKISVSVAPLQ